ncbi:hypothetical protein PTTG_27691 [Puccinia triticina 1-1 BBBD Race 1]|uniref:Uncharacterized protein n=1 Tax=Puccinia triticina (isolate 1-1 / race 1 (BBBD)) TaxID=630390 RepID=A0A180GHU3_PUCT1|nr:hypothetical protein PTTG_27691 [Puccinia triticina 1-1 BBBD Race 1]
MFASIVFPMLVLVQLVSGQVKPSSIRCATADGSQPLLDRRDCTDTLSQFFVESNVVSWSSDSNMRTCGTCRLSLTKPSVRPKRVYNAVFEYALTAVHLGLDECRNQPFNATIGASQPISVILDYGHNGSRCQKPN